MCHAVVEGWVMGDLTFGFVLSLRGGTGRSKLDRERRGRSQDKDWSYKDKRNHNKSQGDTRNRTSEEQSFRMPCDGGNNGSIDAENLLDQEGCREAVRSIQ